MWTYSPVKSQVQTRAELRPARRSTTTGTYFASIFWCADALVEGMFAAATADGDACEIDVHALEIEFHAGASGGGEDASPVRVGAGESGLYQR